MHFNRGGRTLRLLLTKGLPAGLEPLPLLHHVVKNIMCDMQPPGTQIPTTTQLPSALSKATPLSIVLAGPHLPSFIPLVSTAPAYEYMLASHTPHELDSSHKARYRMMFCNYQQIAAAISTLADILSHLTNHPVHASATPAPGQYHQASFDTCHPRT